MREPWKQLPAEDARQFAAFAAYRDFDPSQRTIRVVCEAFHGDSFTENDYRRWLTYAQKHRWKARTRAWDEHKDDVSREVELEEHRKMRREQVGRARRLQEIADKSIERELAKFEADPEYQINPALILQFATQGASMERQVRGDAAPTVKTDEDGQNKLKIEWGAPSAKRTEGSDDPTAGAPSGAMGDNPKQG